MTEETLFAAALAKSTATELYDDWGKPAEAAQWRAQQPPGTHLRQALERDCAWPLLWGWKRW